MNKRFLGLAGVAAVLSVGTYVGLNIIKPHTVEEVKVAETVPAEQVFGASVSNPEPETPGAAAAPVAPAAPASGEQPAAPAAETAAAPATETAAAPAATDTSVAPPAPAAETAAAAPAEAPPAPAAAEPQPAAPAPAAETAAAEPAAAASAPAPEPAAAPVEKPAKAKKSAPAKHAAAKSAASGKPASSGKAWWPKENPNKLSLVYAGQASFKPAIVLMFNGAFFSADSIPANLKVSDAKGKAIGGQWEIGENNRRMLVFAVPAKGSYKVSVGAGLTDNKGRKLGAHLSGPVSVR